MNDKIDRERYLIRWVASVNELNLETCNEPSIVGMSNHQLVVARKAT